MSGMFRNKQIEREIGIEDYLQGVTIIWSTYYIPDISHISL